MLQCWLPAPALRRLMTLLPALLLAACGSHAPALPELTEEQAEWIGSRVFANECNRQKICLTSWNAGEDFPSLGIGHFIWYREGQQEAFVESFPALMDYYRQTDTALPRWLTELPDMNSPWPNRETFHAELHSPQMVELRDFLSDTMPVQVEFIINRLASSLPALQAASDRPEQVGQLFYRIASADVPAGMYALIDYVNFKGEGTAPSERYQGQGWGLLQVLEQMLDHPDEAPLLQQFAAAAKRALAQRVANAPPQRNEARWTRGWEIRIDSYALPAAEPATAAQPAAH